MAQPLPLPSPSFRHNTGPTRMRMMMIAHHRASCCTCTRGHALIICLQKQYGGTLPVALQTVMPTSLPADIQGMQARVSPAATDFASCPQSFRSATNCYSDRAIVFDAHLPFADIFVSTTRQSSS